jgi:hypothetical protein
MRLAIADGRAHLPPDEWAWPEHPPRSTADTEVDRAVPQLGNSVAGFDELGRPLYFEKTGGVHTDALLSCFLDHDIVHSHLWQLELERTKQPARLQVVRAPVRGRARAGQAACAAAQRVERCDMRRWCFSRTC